MQAELLGPEDSDCGTKGYLDIVLPLKDKKLKDFEYRYIIENNKNICLTPEILPKYKGKNVKMRSPMYCVGVKTEESDRCLCNKCMGDFYYKLSKKYVGLLCSRPAETTKRLGMKKFHDNTVKSYQIDVNDMLL